MTTAKYYNVRLDCLLRMFLGTSDGIIEKRVLFDNALEDWDAALDFLVAEGYLEESDYHMKITYKGKAFVEQGGFVGKHLREHVLFYCTIVAALCSAVGLVFSVLALLR